MVSSWHVGSCQMRTCSAHFRPLRGLGSSEHVSRVFARIFVIKSILAFSRLFIEKQIGDTYFGRKGGACKSLAGPVPAGAARAPGDAARGPRDIILYCTLYSLDIEIP